MSALATVFMRDGSSADRDTINRMRNALRLYGGDREAARTNGCFGLGWTHAMGFTPQDRGEFQPMAIGTRFEMLFCGRIDHREELALALGLAAGRLATISDGEMAKLAWERWQDRTPDHLFGDYCYIVCDGERHRLEAVRGPLSAPPLHWYQTSDRFLMASMPKGLFAVPDVPCILDEQKIADFLVLNQEELDASFFQQIKTLPLGHRLIVDRHSVTVTRYYGIENTRDIRFTRDAEYVEAARDLLEQAVASAMRSVETPAISLSSGLDSTTVAVTALDWLAQRHDPAAKPLLGLTSVPEPGWDGRSIGVGDESGPVRALAARYPQLQVEFIDAAGLPIDHGLDAIHDAGDLPSRGVGNNHWGLELNRRALADGRKVMLNGSSGNGTLSLSGAHFCFGQWMKQGRFVHAAGEWRKHGAQSGNSGYPVWRGFAGQVLARLAPGAMQKIREWRGADPASEWPSFSAIHPDYARAMRVEERMADMNWVSSDERFVTHRDMMRRMLDRGNVHNAGARVAAYQAVTGIESRDPLGDRKIAEFCYAIPGDQFFQYGIDRRLIKQIMADRLPEEVLQARRGNQAADWLLRLKRDAGRFDADLERLAGDSAMAARLDIGRLRHMLATLPEKTPLSGGDYEHLPVAMHGFGYGLAIARFIHGIEGRNG